MLLPDTDNEEYSEVLSTKVLHSVFGISGSFIVANSRLVTFNYMQYSMASVTDANNTLMSAPLPPHPSASVLGSHVPA